MEIGHKVSFIILVFWCFIIVFVVWLFIVLSSVFYLFILHPASCICTFLSSARSTDYWGDMGEFGGMGRRGQCTELASWPLDKMCMLLLAVSAQCLS